MNRTKQVTKRRNLFLALSIIVWLGCTLFCVFSIFSLIGKDSATSQIASSESLPFESEEEFEVLTTQAKAVLFSLGTTVIIGIVAAILIKDKVRTAIWMADVVISSIVYKATGMYIILFLWLIEEYVLHALYVYYKEKVSINKEIDLRERAA